MFMVTSANIASLIKDLFSTNNNLEQNCIEKLLDQKLSLLISLIEEKDTEQEKIAYIKALNQMIIDWKKELHQGRNRFEVLEHHQKKLQSFLSKVDSL